MSIQTKKWFHPVQHYVKVENEESILLIFDAYNPHINYETIAYLF